MVVLDCRGMGLIPGQGNSHPMCHTAWPKMGEESSITKPDLGLLACSKANLLTLGCGERESSVYCRLPSKEGRQLVLKGSQLLEAFRERFLKTR